MGISFVVEKIELRIGDEWHAVKLGSSIFRVQGPIGTGKSTLLECLWYPFGVPAALMPAVRDNVSHVRVQVRVNGQRLTLERPVTRGASAVKVSEGRDGEPVFLSSNANRDRQTISDFLMTTMGYPQIELPGGRVQPILTFHDVQMLTYLRQTKISNQLLGDDGDRISQAAVFALDIVLGAYTPEVEEHRRERKRINRRLNQLQQNLGAIKGFLSERKNVTEQQLLSEQLVCEQAIREATRAVEAATARLAPEEATDLALAEAVERAKTTLQATKEDEAALRAELSQLNSAVSTKQKSLKRMRNLAPAPSYCPHCTQLLSRQVSPDQCPVCLQHNTTIASGSATAGAASERLERDLRALGENVERTESHRATVVAKLNNAADDLLKALATQENHRKMRLYPRQEDKTKSIAALDEANAKLAALLPRQNDLKELRGLENEKLRLTKQLEDLDQVLTEANADLIDRRAEIARHLTNAFNEVLGHIGLPGYTDARIDPADYSPFIDGHAFNQLAVSGGRKTITNIGYHLTLLNYGCTNPATLLPNFLVIDSPREGIGSVGADREVVDRTYEYLRNFAKNRHSKHNTMQLVLADNDPARGGKRGFAQVDLSYDDPFVPGVGHPGPGRVATVENLGL